MHEGQVESTRYPRNPLDVLAQQIVAMAGLDTWDVDELFAAGPPRGAVRRPEPADVRRRARHALGPLSRPTSSPSCGRASPGTACSNTVAGREGAKRVAIANAGTIPDRGLYGVFLAGADRPMRVGELDEEMVFETAGRRDVHARRVDLARRGDHARPRARLAGARRAGQDAVLARRSGRPAGGARLARSASWCASCAACRGRPPSIGWCAQHDLDAPAAENLLRYLDDQAAAGARARRSHARHRALPRRARRLARVPALAARQPHPRAVGDGGDRADPQPHRHGRRGDVGRRRLRRPLSRSRAARPIRRCCCRTPTRSKALVLRQLGSTSLFAARFRETAARALLLPRRRPGMRTPLWQQRKRAVGSAGGRVALRLVSGAARDLSRGAARSLRHAGARRHAAAGLARARCASTTIDSKAPSPFAASLLFSYVANYIYDGDAPLAERRAQALSVDQAQLRELLGDAELRELLDPDALDAIERQLQHLDDELQGAHAPTACTTC